jgi:hypothetical protein
MNLDYKNKYLKYKNKYLELKKKLKKQVGGGTGRDIINLLNKIIEINDSSVFGTRAVEEFLKSNDITLHHDSTNTSGIEANIGNIRKLIEMFNEKYAGRLEEAYTDFDEFAIGGYVCLDAKVSVLTDFLTTDNPFKTGRPKSQILGTAMNKLMDSLCSDPNNSRNLSFYRKHNNINLLKQLLVGQLNIYIPKYVTVEEINNFVDSIKQDYIDEVEENILDCNGKLEELREKERNKIMVKKNVSEINNMTILEEGTILLGNNDEELGIISFDNYSPRYSHGFNTNKGWVLKSNIINIIVKE